MAEHPVIPHLDEVRLVAACVWSERPTIRAVLPEREDAQQQAVLYCLHYGLRYHTDSITIAGYFRVMARRGLWHAAQKHREWLRTGKPRHLALEDQPPEQREQAEATRDDGFTADVLNRLEVAQALGVLTLRETQVVSMRWGLDGSGRERSYREIAACLGLAEGTVKATLDHARERLRRNFHVDAGCE